MKFNYDSYVKMLDHLKKNHYNFCDYFDSKKYEKCVILRHDVDMNLEAALSLAKLESEQNVKSTYFILISSDFYNIISLKSIQLIKEIKKLGHNIGLHFDEAKYKDDFGKPNKIKKHIEEELQLMSEILGFEIKTFSYHRPSKEILDSFLYIENSVDSYSELYFKNYKYLSDSRRNWREPVLEVIDSNKYNKLHILTHPIWYNYKEQSMHDALLNFIRKASYERYDSLNDNIRDLESVIVEDEL